METQTSPLPTPSVLHQLWKKRGFSSQHVQELLSWDLKKLPALTQLKDLDKAAQRLIKAIDQKEEIGIYGDYDVDGTTSCALLYHFFQMLGVTVHLFQPSRFVEGYGIHPSAIDQALEKKIKVLMTVDCGITNAAAALYAQEKKMDLIITDHHQDALPEMVPAYAVVNPNRRDEPTDSPLAPLAGVGVAFALCLRLKELRETSGVSLPSLYSLLQFVAIGTLCDMAKLTPMNLKLVRHGLKQIPTSTYPGILSFFALEERKVPMMSSERITFHVGPHINSKGRLDHPEKALNLLTSKDSQEAFENFSHLEISNRERKMIQAQVFKQAKEVAVKSLHTDNPLINIVYQSDWHEGVIGIVASKLVETFEIPAIVFTNTNDQKLIKASARSVENLDLFKLLDSCRDLFTKFGGHKAAAGLTMPKSNLSELRQRLESQLAQIPAIERTKQYHYDLEVEPEDITPQLLKDLESMEPFGVGNPKPIFRLKNVRLESYQLMKDVHVRWHLSSLNNPNKKLKGISFSYIGKWGQPHPKELTKLEAGQRLVPQFTLGINRFNGNEYIQLFIDKMLIA